MKLTDTHAPRAVWGAPGNSTSPERWAMAWKTGLSGYVKTPLPGFVVETSFPGFVTIDPKTNRFVVVREVEGTLIVCGLNPSTAWAQDGLGELDPTLTRIHGFALGLGVSDVCMVNLYPFRHTDPKDLWGSIPWGYDGTYGIARALEAMSTLDLAEPFTVVAAWGATAPPGKPRDWRAADHESLALRAARYYQALGGGQLWCWGTTKAGHPRHPLYLPATAQLQPWRAP